MNGILDDGGNPPATQPDSELAMSDFPTPQTRQSHIRHRSHRVNRQTEIPTGTESFSVRVDDNSVDGP